VTTCGLVLDQHEAFNLDRDGYVKLNRSPTLLPSENFDVLIPKEVEAARDNTYFARFGFGKYPLHTDMAIIQSPPRYVVFRPIVVCSETSTAIQCFKELPPELLALLPRCLVQPRRTNGRRRVHLPLATALSKPTCFRWDSAFLKPLKGRSEEIFEFVTDFLEKNCHKEIVLKSVEDLLLIDNWSTMHGRSAIKNNKSPRQIQRFYLERI
jgi:hypothetical protein